MNDAFCASAEEGMIKSWQKVGFRRPDEPKLHFHPSTDNELQWPKERGPGKTALEKTPIFVELNEK